MARRSQALPSYPAALRTQRTPHRDLPDARAPRKGEVERLLNGAPRSDVKTKGGFGSCSRWSRRSERAGTAAKLPFKAHPHNMLRHACGYALANKGIFLRHQLRRQRLGLLQYVLHRCFLQVGRIAVFTEKALHMPPDVRTGELPVHPVDADVPLDHRDKFLCDHPQGRFSHHLPRALVLGQGVVALHRGRTGREGGRLLSEGRPRGGPTIGDGRSSGPLAQGPRSSFPSARWHRSPGDSQPRCTQ